MQSVATAWNFAPTDNNRLAELMKLFGCADEIAPVDAAAFGRRMGELLTRSLNSPKSARRPSKAEHAHAQKASRSGEAPKSQWDADGFRHLLQCAPRSDRVILAVMAAASTSLILVAATLKLLAQSEVQLMNSTVVSLQLAT
jgi:hypothetical protein